MIEAIPLEPHRRSESTYHQAAVANPRSEGPVDERDVLRAVRRRQLAAMAQRADSVVRVPLDPPARDLHRRILEALAADHPTLQEVLDSKPYVHERALTEIARLTKPVLIHTLPSKGPIDSEPVAGKDEFWWDHTDYWWTGGIEAAWLPSGLHFHGSIDYDGDPLIFRNVGASAYFALSASRRTPAPRYTSRPIIELYGPIVGYTGWHHWLLAADNKWCKLILVLRQTAYQIDGAGTAVVLGQAEQGIQLLNEENEGRYMDVLLPGTVHLPPLHSIQLAEPKRQLWVRLDIELHMQLEGSSYIVFGPGPVPASPNFDPNYWPVLRTLQWHVQPG